ncbi:MAG: hypothetical protein ACKVOP_10280 [Sphingomonadaceae bacterium]
MPPTELAAVEHENGQPANEAKQLASGKSVDELASQAASDDYHRGKAFKDNWEQIAIAAMWVLAIAGMAISATWLYHVLAPENWHWLSGDALAKLQNLFTGGVLVTAFGDHFRKRLN